GKDKIPGWAYKGIKSYEVSIPAPMIMLGVDKKPELECHHTFCHSSLDNMNSIWFDNFKKNKLLGDKNFMLICTPSLSDDSLAPKGHHTLNLVSFSPYEPVEGDWDKGLREKYLEDILDLMKRKFGLDLTSNLKVAEVIDPKRFERRFLHPRGAVYGLQQDLCHSAMFRPGMKSRIYDGLYLTGASTHLGGGVAPTIGSGIAATDLIVKDFG
ncbi:MAG: FAD-dependent oxidoreductase, partial [Actinobacteria bacterium]|nr:FAD-dependent oxidoreductase [Actinomycetota bacterium]